jgi:NADH-quinone oxidoreductase subunit L
VTADNFLQMFFGWEGVGLASYLLIGFWYLKPSANSAAIKAFIVNRIGDFGFILGIAGVFYLFDTLDFDQVFHAIAQNQVIMGQPIQSLHVHWFGVDWPALTIVCLLLFMGAMGKSAQFLLHTWLPDAMEGPTPVSALIHAATMVTAGVFLVCRLSPMFQHAPAALAVVTVIGAITCFFAATIGIAQNDIKRVIAYSTCSQLGYMFFAAGVSAYQAAMFHLFTHAFFKALLFLCAGSVIHALHDEQDMRKMGGLIRYLNWTGLAMIVGTLAITGFGLPYTVLGASGFYSKDAIIEAAFTSHASFGMFAFVLGSAAAFLTALYSWRLIFMTFFGKYHSPESVLKKAHEAPPVMLIPLFILSLGALFAGAFFNNFFMGAQAQTFWGNSLAHVVSHGEAGEGAIPAWVKLTPFVVSILGFVVAYYYYIMRPDLPAKIAARRGPIYLLLKNKWFFDEAYDFLFVRPAQRLAVILWRGGDGKIIDGIGPNGVAARVVDGTRFFVKLQTGYLYHYAFLMLLGIAAAVTYFVWRTGGGG